VPAVRLVRPRRASSAARQARAVLLFALLAVAGRAWAQAPTDEAQVKAAFVYNFLKFVDWPAGATQRSDDPLVVAIIGDGPTADAVAGFLATKRVGDRPIVVRHLAWDQLLTGAHAAFVSENDSRKLRRIFDMAAGAAVLSIGEGHDFTMQGGMISLLIEQRRVRFDIGIDAADAARLRISSRLLALGHVVHVPPRGSGEVP
jgi:hypothetical protein